MHDNQKRAWADWASKQQPAKPNWLVLFLVALVFLLALAHILNILERAAPRSALAEGSNAHVPTTAAAAARLNELVISCLNAPHVIKIGDEVVASCKPERKK